MNKIAKVILARWQLLLFFVLCYWLYSFFIEVFGRSRSQHRSAACANNLRQIGKDILAFRAKNGGSSPRNLSNVITKKEAHYLLQCPNKAVNENFSSYAYKYLDKPESDDVIAWDAQPEIWGNEFTNKSYPPIRNVLRSDGTVKRMSEDDFRRLYLHGSIEKTKN